MSLYKHHQKLFAQCLQFTRVHGNFIGNATLLSARIRNRRRGIDRGVTAAERRMHQRRIIYQRKQQLQKFNTPILWGVFWALVALTIADVFSAIHGGVAAL